MLRDLSVGEEVHDAITGHTIPSASRKNYGGMGMQVKFDAISKLDISFLQEGGLQFFSERGGGPSQSYT